MIYTKKKDFDILSILLRWQIFTTDMCQYLAANFRTTTIPAVSGSTTLPHSVAFFVATRPTVFLYERNKGRGLEVEQVQSGEIT